MVTAEERLVTWVHAQHDANAKMALHMEQNHLSTQAAADALLLEVRRLSPSNGE